MAIAASGMTISLRLMVVLPAPVTGSPFQADSIPFAVKVWASAVILISPEVILLAMPMVARKDCSGVGLAPRTATYQSCAPLFGISMTMFLLSGLTNSTFVSEKVAVPTAMSPSASAATFSRAMEPMLSFTVVVGSCTPTVAATLLMVTLPELSVSILSWAGVAGSWDSQLLKMAATTGGTSCARAGTVRAVAASRRNR